MEKKKVDGALLDTGGEEALPALARGTALVADQVRGPLEAIRQLAPDVGTLAGLAVTLGVLERLLYGIVGGASTTGPYYLRTLPLTRGAEVVMLATVLWLVHRRLLRAAGAPEGSWLGWRTTVAQSLALMLALLPAEAALVFLSMQLPLGFGPLLVVRNAVLSVVLLWVWFHCQAELVLVGRPPLGALTEGLRAATSGPPADPEGARIWWSLARSTLLGGAAVGALPALLIWVLFILGGWSFGLFPLLGLLANLLAYGILVPLAAWLSFRYAEKLSADPTGELEG